MNSDIRFGIVGPGKVARLHGAALSRLPGARLAAVAGRSEERTLALASPYGARADRGLAEMIDRGGVDAVILCTPHPLHRDDAIAVAQAGLHVVVEKPLALTPEDCDAMIEAAEGSGVALSVISQRRWYPACQRVKAAIDEGRIGDPIIGVAEVLGWRGPEYYAMDAWRGTPEGEGGGVLVNQAVHQLDLLTWFMGQVVSVQSVVENLNHPGLEVEDTAVAVLRFASGAVGNVIATNSVRPGLWARVHVHGRTGASVGVETDRGSSFVAGLSAPTLARNDVWTIPGEESLPERWATEDEGTLAAVDVESHFHELQLADIVEAIRDGRPPAVDGNAGRQTVELMAGIYRATSRRTARRIDDWIDVWLDTRISIEGPEGEVDIDETSPPALPWPITVVTANNPRGVEQSDERNRRANLALHRRLTERRLRVLRATGSARQGAWSEPGFAVSGLTRQAAAELGAEFDQLAVFYVTETDVEVIGADGTVVTSRRRAAPRH